MIRQIRRATNIRSTLLLTGTALALVAMGCGSGGGGGGGTGGTVGKKDAAPPTPDLPPSSPDLGPDIATGTGGAISGPEVGAGGAGGAGGSLDSGTGGTGVVDANLPDISTSTGGAPGFDGPIDRAMGPEAAKLDTSAIDSGPFTCPTPVKAWTFSQVPSLNGLAWDQDGSLIAGATSSPGNGTITFGPAPADTAVVPVQLTSNGSADILVSKLDPAIANPQWVFAAGDPKDQYVTGVAVTSAGLGLLGTFKGTLEIATGSQVVNSTANFQDYIAGLKENDGTGVWSFKVDLGGGQLAAIASHPSKDYFVVCGAAMNAAAKLAPVGTPGGGKDVVVAAIEASKGTILWAKLFGGPSDQACTAAALDDDGNAIFAGTFMGSLDFGQGALSPAPADAPDGGSQAGGLLWVAKLNGATGATMAAKSFGTAPTAMPYGLTADAGGNVILSGSFQGSPVTFGTTTLTPVASDAFAAKLDPSLAPVWARRWGNSSALGKAVAVDSRGMVTVVGNFKGIIDVGPGSAALTSSVPSTIESYVVTLDGATGQTLCAHNYGDAAASGGGATGVVVNRWASGSKLDSTAIAGSFTKVIDFGAPTTVLSGPTGTATPQAYLLRM